MSKLIEEAKRLVHKLHIAMRDIFEVKKLGNKSSRIIL